MKIFQTIMLSFGLLAMSLIARPIEDNIIKNAVQLQTTEGTQIIQMQDDGSVLSTEAIIGSLGGDHIKSVASKYSKTLSTLRNKGEKFVYLNARNLNADNVANACLQFIKNNYDKLGIETENLRVQHIELAGNCWDVTFTQTHEGIDVRGGRIQMMVFKNSGRLQTFRSTFFDDITVDKTKPTVSFQAVENAATVGLPNKNYEVKINEKPVIIPHISGKNYRYRLAYECEVARPIAELYSAVIDANTGELISRENLVMNLLTVKSRNYTDNPNEPLETFSVRQVEFKIEGDPTTYRSSMWDNFPTNPPIPENAIGKEFTTNYTGTIAKMFRVDWVQGQTDMDVSSAVPYSYKGTITENGVEMLDSNNYDEVFRTVYHHVNKNHTFFKEVDPQFSGLDKQMNCYVQILPDNMLESQGVNINAYSSPSGALGFYAANSLIAFMAKSAKVVYHEYGHSRVFAKYNAKYGGGLNMNNRAANEACADINAAFITGNPRVFDNAFRTDMQSAFTAYYRNCDNNWTYPDSIRGARHDDSQILSGAFWSLRNLINHNEAKVSVLNAKNYTPDGYTYEEVFTNWFESIILATDKFLVDEEDPESGTFVKNFNEIYAAFNKHRIGYDLLIQNRFEHSNIADQPKDAPIPITATIAEISTPKDIEEIWVNYYTHLNSNMMSVLLTPTVSANGIEYKGEIPAQEDGARLYYHFTYRDPFSGSVNRINRDFFCFVGYDRLYHNSFEVSGGDGWTVSNKGANAANGWIWGVPPAPEVSSQQDAGNRRVVELYSPGFDCTPGGKNAWRTQVSRTWNAQNKEWDFRSLRDTSILTSPNINMTGAQHATLSFYVYYHNTQPTDFSGMNVEVSFDGGNTWKLAPTNRSLRGRNQPKNWNWERVYANITKHKDDNETFGTNFRVRFVCNAGAQTIGLSAMIDEIAILNSENPNNIDDNFVSSDIKVSPNPANDIATVTFPRALYSPEIQVLNVLGTEVMTVNFEGEFNTVPVNTSGLANGVYFVRIKSEGKTYQTKLNVIR